MQAGIRAYLVKPDDFERQASSGSLHSGGLSSLYVLQLISRNKLYTESKWRWHYPIWETDAPNESN
jgi:hypothetical protein